MSTKQKILLVDDDRSLSPLVQEYLEAKDFECHLYHNAFDAFSNFKKLQYNLCILDIRMPMKNGFELASEIKLLEPDIPLLFLTGQTDKEDRIRGLEAGADDYITKPFSMQELYLRIKAILRRTERVHQLKKENSHFEIGKYRFDADAREISGNHYAVKLSTIEARLLRMFCEATDGIIYREAALKQIWDDTNSFRERSLNVYISKLRQYLRDDPDIEILNIHGSGYKMVIKN